MSDVDRLARRAAAGDVAAARRLLALLEDRERDAGGDGIAVTKPAEAEARIRERLVDQVEDAIRNSDTRLGASLEVRADHNDVRWLVSRYEAVGWSVIASHDSPDSVIYHLTLSAIPAMRGAL